MTVHVLPVWLKGRPYNCPSVSTVSHMGIYRDLSPFILTVPCNLGDAKGKLFGSIIFENLWQYSKVYHEHFNATEDKILPAWYWWRDAGWASQKANRYPMGKGRKPLFSYWDGERLNYIEARKKIYAPIYARQVVITDSYAQLAGLYSECGELTLRDYDAYDHIAMGMSLVNVINNPDRKMGHAFVLAMLLEDKLEECLSS